MSRNTESRSTHGQSEVIGVILMVALAVILAAVVATFFFGLGEQTSDIAPQASFSTDYDANAEGTDDFDETNAADGILIVTHTGGTTLSAGELKIVGASNSGGSWDEAGYGVESEINAGDSVTVWVDNDDAILVTWVPADGDQSATLHEWTGPDA